MTPTHKFCESVRDRLDAMDRREIGGADSRAFYLRDIAKLLEIVAGYEAALEWYSELRFDDGSDAGEIAREALKAAEKIAGGGA